jgi:phosphoenolpyruvate-protein phosphotransferase (PTS system enzyme I)
LKSEDKEICLKGISISEGIAFGNAVFLLSIEKKEIPDFPISREEVDAEIARYHQALSSSRRDLVTLQKSLAKEGSSEGASIISTHIEMLADPVITTNVEGKIRELLKNTETAFHTVIKDYQKRFSETTDAFFQQRLSDVQDLSQRVLRNLCQTQNLPTDKIVFNAIVFIKELIPSDTAVFQTKQISAFVTQNGGGTSHAALIARSKGIPYVSGIDIFSLAHVEGKPIIVDGFTGNVFINPSQTTTNNYKKLKSRFTQQYQQLEKDNKFVAETFDGYPLYLYANINTLNDLDLAHQYGCHGIGLFRSEYLFMRDSSLFFDEERQYLIYRKIFKKAGNLPFTFRVLDLGGDKEHACFQETAKVFNPVLGCRGIRFLLQRQDVLKTQLRAVYRAALGFQVRILLPLISDMQEFCEIKNIITEIVVGLKEKFFKEFKLPLGCMLEVPAALLICDLLTEESDFLALGTNDLIQYSLGIDRTNPGMSGFYHPAHPGIIRMIKMAIVETKRFRKPLTVCGEMASCPLFTSLLIGLGVQNLSCSPRFIPIIKRTIRHLSFVDACSVAEHVLTLKTHFEITKYLSECFN